MGVRTWPIRLALGPGQMDVLRLGERGGEGACVLVACNHALRTLGRSVLDEDEIGTFVDDDARKLIARALRTDDDDLIARALDA